MNTYKDDPCECFKLKGNPDYNATEMLMDVKMHKAISVIQFKVESQIIKKNPGFKLEKRNLLHHINYEKGTIELDGKEYKLLDKNSDDRSEKTICADERRRGYYGTPGTGV